MQPDEGSRSSRIQFRLLSNYHWFHFTFLFSSLSLSLYYIIFFNSSSNFLLLSNNHRLIDYNRLYASLKISKNWKGSKWSIIQFHQARLFVQWLVQVSGEAGTRISCPSPRPLSHQSFRQQNSEEAAPLSGSLCSTSLPRSPVSRSSWSVNNRGLDPRSSTDRCWPPLLTTVSGCRVFARIMETRRYTMRW